MVGEKGDFSYDEENPELDARVINVVTRAFRNKTHILHKDHKLSDIFDNKTLIVENVTHTSTHQNR
jgi:hypothetical protein